MSRETSKSFKKEKPEPEKNERGLRYITENFCLKLCEYLGGYEYPQLNSRLYLHFQGFHKIENLNRFINVKVLYLENNLIEKIEGLENLTNLTCLYLQNNYLKKIENLENNKKIVILNLSGNRIKKIENLSNLTKLEYFYIEKNNLSNYEDIENRFNSSSIKAHDIQIFEKFKSVVNEKEFMDGLWCMRQNFIHTGYDTKLWNNAIDFTDYPDNRYIIEEVNLYYENFVKSVCIMKNRLSLIMFVSHNWQCLDPLTEHTHEEIDENWEEYNFTEEINTVKIFFY